MTYTILYDKIILHSNDYFKMVPLIASELGISTDRLFGLEKNGKISMTEESLLAVAKVIDTSSLLTQSQIDCIFEKEEISNIKSKQKILIVDDSDFMRMIVSDILSEKGHEILKVDTGELAINQLSKSSDIDICILDIGLPGISGLEVLERIKSDWPDIKVIMLSNRCDEENVRKAKELNADAFIAKPFNANELLDRI